MEKKVTSLVPATEGSQLQVDGWERELRGFSRMCFFGICGVCEICGRKNEEGNANYANLREYIPVVLCVFSVYLCVTKKITQRTTEVAQET